MELLDRFADAAVQPDPAQRCEPFDQRFTNELVREPEMAHAVVRFVDDAGHPGGFDEVERAVLVDAADVCDERDVELATGDRARGQDRDRFVGEPGQARPQHVANALGYRRARGAIAELAFVLQQADELGDEERVAGGAVVQ